MKDIGMILNVIGLLLIGFNDKSLYNIVIAFAFAITNIWIFYGAIIIKLINNR